VGWKIGDEVVYALEGSVFIAGAAVQWLRDGLGLFSQSAEIEKLAASVDTSDGVVFVPALVGLGAPRWNPDARGIITGITRGTTAAHLARATLEGIAFQVRDVVEAMRQDLQSRVGFLRVDGGAAGNDLLVQFQADVLQVEIHRPTILETTALGAALLAGLAAGVFKSKDEILKNWQLEKGFKPQRSADEVVALLANWETAVSKA
jgi:glycerol kinase